MNGKDDFIVLGVNQKDKKIWRDFYDRYYAALCSYVSKFLSVSDAVEDLVQEVFISVWEGTRHWFRRLLKNSRSWAVRIS